MDLNTPPVTVLEFSKDAIERQVDKIISDPLFEKSGILKSFLQFIVGETINGHANQLKEYTIALSILHKPLDFNPQENGILRIHAGRLRRALEQYYGGPGTDDAIRISIPKGNYVPVFSDNADKSFFAHSRVDGNNRPLRKNGATVTVAVIPFNHTYGSSLTDSFTDGIGLQLSAALVGVEHCAVTAYYSMRKIAERFSDIKTISNIVGADYIITGDIQSNADHMRVYVQVIDTLNSQLNWAKMYQGKLNSKNIFNVQDEIVKEVKTELEQIAGNKAKSTMPADATMAAVA